MKTIQTIINGRIETLEVREFCGMYQVISGPYMLGIVRKDEVL